MSTSIRIRIEENEHCNEQRGEQHSWAPMAQQAYCREGQNVFRERCQPQQGAHAFLPPMQLYDGPGEQQQQRGFAPPPQESPYAPQRENCAPSGGNGGQNLQREINDIGKMMKNVFSVINSFEHTQNPSATPATAGDQSAAPAQSASNGGDQQPAQSQSRGGDQQVASAPTAANPIDQPAAASAAASGSDQSPPAAAADQPAAAPAVSVADNSPASSSSSDDSGEWN